MSATWTFQQIEGADAARLELKGWNAPFGRPRKDPIFTEIIKSRAQTTYYPGKSGRPARHAFGTNWEPIELKGRWMSQQTLQFGGLDANAHARQWITFVQAQRQCRMAWGFILSYEVFIEELHLSRESEDQIAWKMKIQIDTSDEDKSDRANRFQQRENKDTTMDELMKFVSNSKTLVAPVLPNLATDFLDQLDNLAAQLNGPSAALNRLAGKIADFKRAGDATIGHFSSAITGVVQGITAIRDHIIPVDMDSALTVRSAESDLAFIQYREFIDSETAALVAGMKELARRAELAGRSEASKFITAVEGDSWESLATRAYGGPQQAPFLRLANGARYGERPETGQTYLIP